MIPPQARRFSNWLLYFKTKHFAKQHLEKSNKIPINCKYLRTLHFSFIYNSVTRELSKAKLSRPDYQIFVGAESCLKILILKNLSLKPVEEFVTTFSNDRVLPKTKHSTQK